MKRKFQMTGKRKYLLYTGYTVCAGFFFFYILFPADPVKKYLDGKLAAINPLYSFTVDTIKPALPLGISLHSATFYHGDFPLLEAQRVSLSPLILSLFGSNPGASFHIYAYQGKIQGKVHTTDDPFVTDIGLEAAFSDVRIKEIPLVKRITPHTVEGTASGTAVSERVENAAAVLSTALHLTDFHISFVKPFFTLESLRFSHIDADIRIRQSHLEITFADIQGREMDGSLAGTIQFRNPLSESVLVLEGTVAPHPALFEGREHSFLALFFSRPPSAENVFSFTVRGTLDKPVLSLK